MYISTTYFYGAKYHQHELANHTLIRCEKNHKKPIPLSQRVIPYAVIYLLGLLTPIIIYSIN